MKFLNENPFLFALIPIIIIFIFFGIMIILKKIIPNKYHNSIKKYLDILARMLIGLFCIYCLYIYLKGCTDGKHRGYNYPPYIEPDDRYEDNSYGYYNDEPY